MDALQLWHALSSDARTRLFFDGVYAVDTLPTLGRRPKMLVCNTDPSSKPGRHWLLLFWDGDVVEMFDSLGRTIMDYDLRIYDYALENAKEVRWLKRRLQEPRTDSCGHYCLYYAYMRCRGFSMAFIQSTVPNEEFLRSYVDKVFDIPHHHIDYQQCTDC